ncbi:MAG: (2Fe-2S)-binding protein [Sporolactobacillus sp.]|nr:(2Fe-2S)-binding protein [Sporolactobacillus sp.]
MSDCCISDEMAAGSDLTGICPSCKKRSKKIGLITLKSLLNSSALDTLNAEVNHYFCATKDCNVVYFDINEGTYSVQDIKVKVYQKDDTLAVPICYCFGWIRQRIKDSLRKGLPTPTEYIRKNIKANRCVNNPQGSCCLGNVARYIKNI